MMRRTRKKYGSYTGRSTTADKLRTLAIVLLVLVLLAVAGLAVSQKYIVYSDEGPRLELPFLREEKEEKQNIDPGELEVIYEEEKPKPKPEPEPARQEPWLRAVALPLTAVSDGTAEEQARAAGANGIVFNMKTDRGVLGYRSEEKLALEMGTNGGDEAFNEKLRALGEGELYLVARISCFRDHLAADILPYAIETNPGRRWYDESGVRWTNPASPQVRAYLVGVMKELSELGFDEILLENCGYPTAKAGKLEYIKRGPGYDPENLDRVVGSFLEEAAKALEGSGTRVSIAPATGEITGRERESGLGPEALLSLPGRIWTGQDAATVQDMFREAGTEHSDEKIVESVSVFDAGRDINQVRTAPKENN